MLTEAAEDRRCLDGGEHLAFAVGDGRGDLDGGDAGDINHGGWAAARQAANPRGAFSAVPLRCAERKDAWFPGASNPHALETFHATLRVNESRAAKLGQQAGSESCVGKETSTAKRTKRMRKYGPTVHPEKTRLVRFNQG